MTSPLTPQIDMRYKAILKCLKMTKGTGFRVSIIMNILCPRANQNASHYLRTIATPMAGPNRMMPIRILQMQAIKES